MRQAGRGILFAGVWLLLLSSLVVWAQQQEEAKPADQLQDHQAAGAALRARVQAFWETRVKGDTVTEYQFLEPRARRRVPVEAFVQSRLMVRYRKFAIDAVSVEGDGAKGTATVSFTAEVYPPLPQAARRGPFIHEQKITEEWVKVEGEWYHRWRQEPKDEGGSQ